MYHARLHDTCSGQESCEGNSCVCCCYGCTIHCAYHNPNHFYCSHPSRYWWWYKNSDLDWGWRLFYRGSDEWCNKTVAIRLPFRSMVLSLTFPLRLESCDECIEPFTKKE